MHPRTQHRLRQSGQLLTRDTHHFALVDPLPYLDFVHLMASATCVLTDSGGIQEETTVLGVPCLTLRANTERPITVTQGTNQIVGLDADRIARVWEQIRRGEWRVGCIPDLWDGKAAERIVKILLGHGGRGT